MLLVVLAAALASRRVIDRPAPTRVIPDTTSQRAADDSIDRYLAPVPAAALPANPAFLVGLAADPFRGIAPPAPVPSGVVAARPPRPPAQSWALTAILITDARRAAVIDEQLVGVGDMLAGGGRVLAVEKDYVLVTTANGARRQLSLPNTGGA